MIAASLAVTHSDDDFERGALVGIVARTTPSGADVSVAHGMLASRVCGVCAMSGAITDDVSAFRSCPAGHSKPASTALTGSSGVRAHSTMPAIPATIAIHRAVPAEILVPCPDDSGPDEDGSAESSGEVGAVTGTVPHRKRRPPGYLGPTPRLRRLRCVNVGTPAP